MPLSEALAGAPTARLAVLDPLRVFGAKATAISQLAPGCRVGPQPFEVIRKSAALVPWNAAAGADATVPSLRTVNV